MRRAFTLVVLVLAFAAPAAGQALHGRFSTPPPAPAATRTPPPPAPEPAPPMSPWYGAAASGQAQCRAGCARAYYFCSAQDGPEACSSNWSRCRADCEAGGLALSGPAVRLRAFEQGQFSAPAW